MKQSFIFTCLLLIGLTASANNMLVQNVTTLGNDPVNKTIQVQFDINWDNSWRDSINYDAAWIFIKFKDANGLWQHAKLNQTGFNLGTGTADSIKVTSDKVGTWIYRSGLGSGTFNCTGVQLQWNYGLSGLTAVTGLEVRVFAVEMVYVPEGEFNCAKNWIGSNTYIFEAPGGNLPVINRRMSLSYKLIMRGNTTFICKIKGDAGIDTDNNGNIDNVTYPTGYNAFFCYKYELTEQQYADFFNTLTLAQITTLGGLNNTNITITSSQYFSSTPNKVLSDPVGGSNSHIIRTLAFADWAGVRPLTFLEFNKASYGPAQPVMIINSSYGNYYPAWLSSSIPAGLNPGNSISNAGYLANSNSNRISSGGSYYGIMDLTGNAVEPVVKLNYLSFTSENGNGVLTALGYPDVSNWGFQTTSGNSVMIEFVEQLTSSAFNAGMRYSRSAE